MHLSQNELREILKKYKTVAVVGLSRDPDKDSHRVSAYLKQHGFRIIPVNPFADEVLGEKSWINCGHG
jgi:predicted CoA-binding protein